MLQFKINLLTKIYARYFVLQIHKNAHKKKGLSDVDHSLTLYLFIPSETRWKYWQQNLKRKITIGNTLAFFKFSNVNFFFLHYIYT